MSALPKEKKISRVMVLPDELANQIAAGEVVERPMSVVKELVENSIDAGATRILVEVEAGGKNLIRVVDNGMGMPPEDARLAFARHATSKIACSVDLAGIASLGFRGEALPSIASVAKVRMTTSSDERRGGTQVVVEGGAGGQVKDAACPRGTTIEVAELFYNTPARRKFLKADSTESSHITQVVTQQALAYPHIHFTLTHNGRKVVDTLPTDQPLYRIAELFGAELAKELVQVNAEAGGYRLTGFISSPVYTRASRSAQYCYINQRFVRDKVILHSTQHGYSHLLPKGQHPAIVLFLSMDPTLYDVNVHPAKAEVRFAFQQEVHRFVSEAVKKALSDSGKLSSEHQDRTGVTHELPNSADRFKGKGSGGSQTKGEISVERPAGDLSRALEIMYKSPSAGQTDPSHLSLPSQIEIFGQKPVPVGNLIYSEFEPLGQLDRSFIIMQGKRGILVVDQHIAHERVLYDRFSKAARHKRVEVQQLLFPLALEFSPGEAELLERHRGKLGELGLELETFGKNEFLLRSVPAILKNNDHAGIMREIVDMLPAQQHEETLNEKFEEILVMMSCRNAIKVNHTLDKDQIQKLITDLEQTEMPSTCPHGRPIALLFEMDDILKKFLRK
ncbi:DNA mismatch repair protein MutL [Candidatus Nitromaritima sp. SCGC AAA799-C22]|nr:DNA mismatch repair protein MutL [Candidatus Nitromaritima sp. SCGC AAA799-C22]